MRNYISILFSSLSMAIRSEFMWIVILFVLWEYRVSFMSDTGLGVAKILQVIAVFGLLFLINKHKYEGFSWSVRNTNAPVLTCAMLYVLALASTLWAYMPSFAFFLALQNLMLIFLFLWFLNLFSTFEEVESAFLIFSSLLLIFIWVTLRIVDSPSLFMHHLSGASAGALLFSYTIGELLAKNKYTYANRKTLLLGGCILSLFVLVTHTSSGANASAAFGFSIALFFSGNLFWASLLMFFAGWLLFNQDKIDNLLLMIMPGKNEQTLGSATGRDILWDYIMKIAAQKPLFGWGFACAERVVTDKGFDAVDSHNTYIGIYGGLGYVGCFFMGAHLISQFLYSFSRRMRPGYLGILSATSCAILNGYSYGFLSGKASSITVMYIALVCLTHVFMVVDDNEQTIEL